MSNCKLILNLRSNKSKTHTQKQISIKSITKYNSKLVFFFNKWESNILVHKEYGLPISIEKQCQMI